MYIILYEVFLGCLQILKYLELSLIGSTMISEELVAVQYLELFFVIIFANKKYFF